MSIFLLLFIAQFSINYQNFVGSPASDSVFINLTRGYHSISEFADDPVVLWFWRSTSGDPQADSLLKRIHMRKNFHLSAVLRWEAKEAADYATKVSKLNLATHLDSTAAENFLSFISLGVKHRDLGLIRTALFLPVLSDFRNQLLAMTNLVILAFATAFLWGVIYVIVKIVYYLPALGHQLWPRFHFRFVDILKVLVLLIPIIVLRNPYLIFVCYAFLLMLVMTTREKNWLRLDILILLLIFILSLPVNNFIVFLKGNNQNYHIYELVTYDTAIDAHKMQNIDRKFLAYGLKQQGNIEEAMELYEDLFYSGKRDIAIINNLANIYAVYDETALAESLYNMAILSADRGEPYFNMGLLKLGNIEYSESSRYMDEARRRGFTSPHESFVDIAPDNNDLYKFVLAENLESNGLVKTAYIIPLILIMILSFIPFKLSPPFFCTSCGRAVCKDCLKEIDQETLCQDCFNKFKSTKKDEAEQALRRTVGRHRRFTKKIILYALNIIIPGAGLIYIKKHLVGSILVCLVLLAYIPLFSPQIFVTPTGWIALSLHPIALFFAILIAIISYIISFSMIREHHAN
jgi:tetratricopeptide (TPR) repeat protein